jgi:hypothetical protein
MNVLYGPTGEYTCRIAYNLGVSKVFLERNRSYRYSRAAFVVVLNQQDLSIRAGEYSKGLGLGPMASIEQAVSSQLPFHTIHFGSCLIRLWKSHTHKYTCLRLWKKFAACVYGNLIRTNIPACKLLCVVATYLSQQSSVMGMPAFIRPLQVR